MSKFTYLSFLLFSFLFLACNNSTPSEDPIEEMPTAEVPMHNTLSAAEQAAGWTLLFDGTDVCAWRGYNKEGFPERGWKIENGEISCEYSGTDEAGYGGDIITRKKYKDFDLKVDFAIVDTSNSGIFYLVQELPETPIYHSAAEYQILDDETYKVTYPGLTLAQCTGANYGLHPQEVNYSTPIGDWNTARIVKQGNEVKHYLNDSLVVAYTLHSDDWEERRLASKFVEWPSYATVDVGHIGLQDHGHLVRFRNVKVLEL
ncbi:MAG: DUF1080 domain-containing protein [Saprospiraceae bacterium]